MKGEPISQSHPYTWGSSTSRTVHPRNQSDVRCRKETILPAQPAFLLCVSARTLSVLLVVADVNVVQVLRLLRMAQCVIKWHKGAGDFAFLWFTRPMSIYWPALPHAYKNPQSTYRIPTKCPWWYARVAGRRIAVEHIVVWHEQLGLSVDEIASQYDLELADVYAALAYYFAHRAEINQTMLEGNAFVDRQREESPSLLKEKFRRRTGA